MSEPLDVHSLGHALLLAKASQRLVAKYTGMPPTTVSRLAAQQLNKVNYERAVEITRAIVSIVKMRDPSSELHFTVEPRGESPNRTVKCITVYFKVS